MPVQRNFANFHQDLYGGHASCERSSIGRFWAFRLHFIKYINPNNTLYKILFIFQKTILENTRKMHLIVLINKNLLEKFSGFTRQQSSNYLPRTFLNSLQAITPNKRINNVYSSNNLFTVISIALNIPSLVQREMINVVRDQVCLQLWIAYLQ